MSFKRVPGQPSRRESSSAQPTVSPSPSPSLGNADSSRIIIVLIIVAIFLIALFIVVYTSLRRLRAQNCKPKYIPSSYLKRKWQAWIPRNKYGQVAPYERSHNLSTTTTSYNPSIRNAEEGGPSTSTTVGVNRNTSVRSIMTLPAYSQTPQETEQVIGREGERAGMDTVVEFPETVDEHEAQREEQMESLYQIRVARRREIAEREQRRQERRDARNRGDWSRLEQLRRDSRSRANEANLSNLSLNETATTVSAATLLAEHQSRGRERRVSAVTYASVGHVRHDGSRLRANSDESERGALLDRAAPMGEGQGRSRGISDVASTLSRPHTRERSNSSALSISTTASDLENPVSGRATPISTQDAPRTSNGSGTSNSSPTANRFTPDESTGSEDIGESRIPPPAGDSGAQEYSRPPAYDNLDWGDAPAYEPPRGSSSTEQLPQPSIYISEPDSIAAGGTSTLPSRAPRLPQFGPLPSINVEIATEPNTPIIPEHEDRRVS